MYIKFIIVLCLTYYIPTANSVKTEEFLDRAVKEEEFYGQEVKDEFTSDEEVRVKEEEEFIFDEEEFTFGEEDLKKTLEDSYDDCRQWSCKTIGDTITYDELCTYLTFGHNNKKNQIIIRKYGKTLKDEEKQDITSLVQYGKLLKDLCRLLWKSNVQICSWFRKFATKNTSLTIGG